MVRVRVRVRVTFFDFERYSDSFPRSAQKKWNNFCEPTTLIVVAIPYHSVGVCELLQCVSVVNVRHASAKTWVVRVSV